MSKKSRTKSTPKSYDRRLRLFAYFATVRCSEFDNVKLDVRPVKGMDEFDKVFPTIKSILNAVGTGLAGEKFGNHREMAILWLYMVCKYPEMRMPGNVPEVTRTV